MKKIQSAKNHKDYFGIDNCRGCNSPRIEKVIDLGAQPVANGFLKKIQKEDKYPLFVVYCHNCHLVQLGGTVDKYVLFEDYVYQSSVSPVFQKHFEALARMIKNQYKPKFVIDVGSNDGILLRPLLDLGIDALGIEPSRNMVRYCANKGWPTIQGWVDDMQQKTTPKVQANVVTACNVFAHIHNISGSIENVKRMLSPDGTFIIEVQYLKRLIQNTYFDMIYHEHFFYYTVTSMDNTLRKHGMKIVDVEEIPTHGGSIRVHAAHILDKRIPSAQVWKMKFIEWLYGYNEPGIYKRFSKKIEKVKKTLVAILEALSTNKRVVYGFGAPAKANTLLNYFKLNKKHIQGIYDEGEYKQGMYTPGSHIPVKNPWEAWVEPDYIVILAWNFAKPIIEKLLVNGYTGQIIVPLPKPHIVNLNEYR